MGQFAAGEIDAWLRNGGSVVTASDRAARSLAAAFHRARRHQGLSAWPAPAIQSWNEFILAAWKQRTLDARLILNLAQEQSLWAGIIVAYPQTASFLEGPRHRTASLAMEAHALLCAFAPQLLQAGSRTAWQQDHAAFSTWLAAFEEACRAGHLVSPARLPLELIPLLSNPPQNSDTTRPAILLAGFDRIQPIQRRVFDAWGEWHDIALDAPAGPTHFYESPDTQTELEACAIWCSHQLTSNPDASLLVITQDAGLRRGELDRTFLRLIGSESLFEFSLGIPFTQVPLAQSAHLLLRWLTGPLGEHELDWFFAAGYAGSPQECSALQGSMRALRHRSLEQPAWSLNAFLAQPSPTPPLPESWRDRITKAQQRLADLLSRTRSALDWAEFATQLLEDSGWPGPRALSSSEFQAARRFQEAIETTGSLGFDGHSIPWQDFLSAFTHVLEEALFTPQSHGAPIQIAGPAESAGLTADAIWFLGATEDAWPRAASMHPLIPPPVQRQFAMPHATPQLDWELAHSITTRLLTSAHEVHFSFARQIEGVESRASRVIENLVGAPQPLPPKLVLPPTPAPLTLTCEDASLVAFPPGKAEGGAAVLTAQSQCAFKAFATHRLSAQKWNPAQPCLTPAQRGLLLHAVLHAIWAGPPDGLRSLNDLRNLQDLPTFITGRVRRVFEQKLRGNLRARMPRAYLDLEEQRLIRLISEWLAYESTRADFEVLETEAEQTIHLAGLTLKLRLDRLDRLTDNTLLVIDYKTGDVSPNSWAPPRPEDVQLPLYAGFALPSGEILGGLTFARLRAGKISFAGRIGDAQATLLPGLTARSSLVTAPFTNELLIDWRQEIEQLARDFLAGRANVNPREYPQTCKQCNLQTLCRVTENPPGLDADSDGESADAEEADDE